MRHEAGWTSRGVISCTIAGVLACVSAVCANSITLRPALALEAAREVTVGDVAEVSGEEAARAAGVRVLSEDELVGRVAGRSARVTLAEVRAALGRSGVPASRLALSGAACEIRVGPVNGVTAPTRNASKSGATAARAVGGTEPQLAEAMIGGGDVRAVVVRGLVDFLGVPASSLRLSFEWRDAEWIGQAVNGRAVIARPLNTSAASGSVVVDARLIENGQEVAARTLSVRAEVLRPVLKVTRDVARRGVLGPGDVEVFEQWVSPGTARAAGTLDPDRAIGQTARTGLIAGTVLTQELLSTPMAVRRNELIDVWVYHGNVAVKARATALKDGGIGEVIPARLDRRRSTFTVRIDGERRGVVVGEAAAPGGAASAAAEAR